MTDPRQSFSITVPMPPVASNRRGSNGWRAGWGEKKSYKKQLDELQGAGLIPPPPKEPFVRASIESTMILGGAMDDDNALFRHKPLIDWLKTRGYIVDDRKKNLTWLGLPTQVVTRKMEARISLVLTEL